MLPLLWNWQGWYKPQAVGWQGLAMCLGQRRDRMSTTESALSDPDRRAPGVPRSRHFKTLRVIGALILRELESSESRTSLGFLWAFIDPIATIILMSLVFSVVSRVPPVGDSFPLFYMTGIVPFALFAALSSKAAAAPKFSRPLLSFPAVRALDTIIARAILHFFIQMVVFAFLAISIIRLYDLNPSIDALLVIEALALAACLGFGMGCLNAVLFLLVPSYENLWSVFTRPLMLASGVLIPIDIVPEPYKSYLWWNPVAHPIELMRAAFYPEVGRENASALFVFMVALTAFVIGLVMLHRLMRDALEG